MQQAPFELHTIARTHTYTPDCEPGGCVGVDAGAGGGGGVLFVGMPPITPPNIGHNHIYTHVHTHTRSNAHTPVCDADGCEVVVVDAAAGGGGVLFEGMPPITPPNIGPMLPISASMFMPKGPPPAPPMLVMIGMPSSAVQMKETENG